MNGGNNISGLLITQCIIKYTQHSGAVGGGVEKNESGQGGCSSLNDLLMLLGCNNVLLISVCKISKKCKICVLAST